jgi:hypothetical protein
MFFILNLQYEFLSTRACLTGISRNKKALERAFYNCLYDNDLFPGFTVYRSRHSFKVREK